MTVLLPAEEWKFTLNTHSNLLLTADAHENLSFPPLPGFLDELIKSWLDCPTDDAMLLLHLACQISYLYAHVPALKQQSFAEQMKYKHRQIHFDALAGMESGNIQFRKHQRTIRDALLQDQSELRECSASRDNEYLFDTGRARISLCIMGAIEASHDRRISHGTAKVPRDCPPTIIYHFST
jgi:hypothetical protein